MNGLGTLRREEHPEAVYKDPNRLHEMPTVRGFPRGQAALGYSWFVRRYETVNLRLRVLCGSISRCSADGRCARGGADHACHRRIHLRTETPQPIPMRAIGNRVRPTENVSPCRNSAGPTRGVSSCHARCMAASVTKPSE